MTNVAALLTRAASERPDATALKLDGHEVSYAALESESARVAGLLRERGVAAGDRVGLMLPNLPQFASVFFGALRAGAVVVPMNVLLKEREVAFYLGDPEAKLLFAWQDFAGPAEAGCGQVGADCLLVGSEEFATALGDVEPSTDVTDRAGQDTALILYTSGTTGTPKGAELTHDNISLNIEIAYELVAPYVPETITLGALPLFHVFGLISGLGSVVRAAGTLTLLPRFDPAKALEVIQRDRVTVFLGVPTMYAAMLHVPDRGSYDTSSLTLCVSGGAAMPVEVMRGFEDAFDCKVLEGYGLSETAAMASFNPPDRERKPGSIGLPIKGVEMKLLDDDGREVPQRQVGEIVIRGSNVMKGYWRKPAATSEAIDEHGWFHTGDMAKVDEDGYFFIVDRKKDMIIRGGYNVYPREIEEVIYEHPAVREAAVVGVPHPELGEEVAAAVAVREGQSLEVDQLRDFVKQRVAAYKYPRRIWLVDELPKGPTGKVLKRSIEAPKE